MKIYDCFIFFNELNLLELRFKILDKVVDYFVIVEAIKTKSGEEKELFFEKNKKRFKKWNKKIIHVVVRNMPNPGKITTNNFMKIDSKLGLGRWKLEGYQTNQIKRGLKNAKDEDIIIVSDVDEIPNPEKFELMKEKLKKEKLIGFRQRMYYYYLNGFKFYGWPGTKACTFKSFKKNFKSKAYRVRRMRNLKLRLDSLFGKKIFFIDEGGWHFSYLLKPKEILLKMKHLCGQEDVKKKTHSLREIRERINKGEDLYGRREENIKYVSIDKAFPKEIYENKKKYKKYIKKI